MGFLFVFLFVTRIRKLQVTGIADMLALRFPDYGEVIRIPAAVGLVVRNVTVLGMNFAAMSLLFTFYTGIDQKLATLISLSVVLIYTISSGLWGVVVTDVLFTNEQGRKIWHCSRAVTFSRWRGFCWRLVCFF